MTFADLQEAVARLSQDPRIHPNTRIELEYETATETCEIVSESSPLLSIAVIDHKIVLASTRAEPAIAR